MTRTRVRVSGAWVDVPTVGPAGPASGYLGQPQLAISPIITPPDTMVGAWTKVPTGSAHAYIVSTGVQNEEVVWWLPLGPGVYDLQVNYFGAAANRGIATFAVDNGDGVFVDVGTVDMAVGGDMATTVLTGVVVTGAAQRRRMRMKMATKSGGSSGYYACLHGFTWKLTTGGSLLGTVTPVVGSASCAFDVPDVLGIPACAEGYQWIHNPVNFGTDATGLYMKDNSNTQSSAFLRMNSNDMEVAVKIVGRDGNGAVNDGGVFARYKDFQNFYYLDAYNNTARLIKVAANSLSVIGSWSTLALNDIIKLKIQGNAYTVYKNGVSVGSGTDSSIATGKYAGLKPPSTVTSWRLRDFVATAL